MDVTDPDSMAGDLATIVDVGGILGAIAAGYISDTTGSSSITCAVLLILSVPSVSEHVSYRLRPCDLNLHVDLPIVLYIAYIDKTICVYTCMVLLYFLLVFLL